MPVKWITKRVRKMCTYIILHPKPGEPNWGVREVERIVTIKTWVPDYYEILLEREDMKKKAKIETPTPEAFVLSADPFYRKIPSIDEVMNNPWYEDGDPRERGNLKITSTTSGVQLILTDPDNEESAFTSAATVREALESLEGALAKGASVWRPWPDWMKKKVPLTKRK